MRVELESRDGGGRFGVMADVQPAQQYGNQRVWAQPARLRDFYAITVEQPMGELLIVTHPGPAVFLRADLCAVRGPGSLGEATERFEE